MITLSCPLLALTQRVLLLCVQPSVSSIVFTAWTGGTGEEEREDGQEWELRAGFVFQFIRPVHFPGGSSHHVCPLLSDCVSPNREEKAVNVLLTGRVARRERAGGETTGEAGKSDQMESGERSQERGTTRSTISLSQCPAFIDLLSIECKLMMQYLRVYSSSCFSPFFLPYLSEPCPGNACTRIAHDESGNQPKVTACKTVPSLGVIEKQRGRRSSFLSPCMPLLSSSSLFYFSQFREFSRATYSLHPPIDISVYMMLNSGKRGEKNVC